MRTAQLGRLILATVCAAGLSAATARAAPLQATFKPVPGKAATALVTPAKGAVLRLAAPGGVKVVVTIPAGAVGADTQVTVTPIHAFKVAPVHGGFVAGVQLAPEGLQLLRPGSVQFRPRTGLRPKARFFLGSAGDGRDVSLVPPAFRKIGSGAKAKLDVVRKAVVPILHFSTVEAFNWSRATLRDVDAIRNPTQEIDRTRQDLATLLAVERQQQILGFEDTVPLSQMEEVLEHARDRLIKPYLAKVTAALASHCGPAALQESSAALGVVLMYLRQAQLLAMSSDEEAAALMGPVLKGVATCLLQQCARYGPRLYIYLTGAFRQLGLIGTAANETGPKAFLDILGDDLAACLGGEVHVDSVLAVDREAPGDTTHYSFHVEGRAPFMFTGTFPTLVPDDPEVPLQYVDAHGVSQRAGSCPAGSPFPDFIEHRAVSGFAAGVFRVGTIDFNQIDLSVGDVGPPLKSLTLAVTTKPEELFEGVSLCTRPISGHDRVWATRFGGLHPTADAPTFPGASFVAGGAGAIASAVFTTTIDDLTETTLVEVVSKPGPITPLPDPFPTNAGKG